ncbi:hypothetical protein ACQEVF_06135 [Nonomuraea polychroma]|uniref:hypothetical protein n=1 Tax=Nonomuraea polychroma TaxID=46176 RepID=UPI003D8F0F93
MRRWLLGTEWSEELPISWRTPFKAQRRLLPLLLAGEVSVALADIAYIPVLLPALLLVGPMVAAHCLTIRQTGLLAGTALVLALLLPSWPNDSTPT